MMNEPRIWHPTNPPSHTADCRLAIQADFKKTSESISPVAANDAQDDEDDFYVAYTSELGWIEPKI